MATKKQRKDALMEIHGALLSIHSKISAVYDDWEEEHDDKSERWRNSKPGIDEEIHMESLDHASDGILEAMDEIMALVEGSK